MNNRLILNDHMLSMFLDGKKTLHIEPVKHKLLSVKRIFQDGVVFYVHGPTCFNSFESERVSPGVLTGDRIGIAGWWCRKNDGSIEYRVENSKPENIKSEKSNCIEEWLSPMSMSSENCKYKAVITGIHMKPLLNVSCDEAKQFGLESFEEFEEYWALKHGKVSSKYRMGRNPLVFCFSIRRISYE